MAAAEYGVVRLSRRGGMSRTPTTGAALDNDKSVVMKTRGKVASPGQQNPGVTRRRSPMAVLTPGTGLVVRQRGRAAVPLKTGTSA